MLIPFIDLINHNDISEISGHLYFDINTKFSNFFVERKISINEELFIYYGHRTNREFLLHNGFVPNFLNTDDTYELRLGFFFVLIYICNIIKSIK